MKLRQTFTISPDVSMRARDYARRKGISLSSLVEQLLRERTASGSLTEGKGVDRRSFSQRWTGKGELAKLDDPRSRRLRKKYDV